MRKSHLVILVIAAVMALSSAYSLAAINQVYKVEFEWYSQYKGRFMGEYRETVRDRYVLQKYPEKMKFRIVSSEDGMRSLKEELGGSGSEIYHTDLDKFILMHCTFGKVSSPEYRIKIIDIAQRGSIVEIKVSINSPEKPYAGNVVKAMKNSGYTPQDTARIKKTAFIERGALYFIFKSQDGKRLHEEYCEI